VVRQVSGLQEGPAREGGTYTPLCQDLSQGNTPKWKAEQMLREIMLKDIKGVGSTSTLPPDDSVTFRWFVNERCIPMRRGSWSPAY